MPIGHQRINDRQVRPNPNILFIHVLQHLPQSDQAQKILEALAAQFKPITKDWGFGVNSLREHEWNPEFAGRNWNAGEVIEIVLRRPDGSFAPYNFLLMVMAHELAHIKEMNHSSAFKKVNAQIRDECAALRAKGYYGDGFWSSGKSLKYGGIEVPLDDAEQPMYICDGARKRKQRRKRKDSSPTRERGSVKKLGQTGRQTRIPRKAGGRVSRQGAFVGEGQALSDKPEDSTFRKRTSTKDAKAVRAMAAERRRLAEQAAAARAHIESEADRKPRVKSQSPAEEEDQKAVDRPAIDVEDGFSDQGEFEEVNGLEEDFDDDAWEYEDPRGAFDSMTDSEKRFLRDEMDDWVVESRGGAVASGSGSGTKPAVGPAGRQGSGEPSNSNKRSTPLSTEQSLCSKKPKKEQDTSDGSADAAKGKKKASLPAETTHARSPGKGQCEIIVVD